MYNFAHKPTIGDLSKVIALLVQDNIEEGSVDRAAPERRQRRSSS